jgi:hypothetical protein
MASSSSRPLLLLLALSAASALSGCPAEDPPPGGSAGTGGGGGQAGTGGPAVAGSGGRGGTGGAGATGGSAGRGPDARRPDAARTPDAGRAPDAVRAPDTGRPRDGGAPAASDAGSADGRFSFFYTSLAAMRRLSESQNGFGGNLTFGTASGLEGADKICQSIAAGEGFGSKTWRAFLSVVQGPGGQPVHAIDRIGEGPWYDRNGRLIASTKVGLLTGNRPMGDAQAVRDLVDEQGRGRPTSLPNDTHDVITGSNRQGRLATMNRANTCQDWTSTTGTGSIQVGHSWPSNGSGPHWITAHTTRSCAAGVNLVQNGPGNGQSIGSGGGWGGFYCFALTP